jgi:2-C-methyl-D-erythritol 4-phosphate cytidylyltransferase
MTPRAGAVILATRQLDPSFHGPPVADRVLDILLLRICTRTMESCPQIDGFVVVAAPGVDDEALSAARASAKFLSTVPSGSTARDSVGPAVEALPPEFDRVVLHDVARPLASPELFSAVVRALEDADGVVPGVPVAETVKRVEEGRVRATIPRTGLWTLQTPTGFRRAALMAATPADVRKAGNVTEEVWSLQGAGYRVVTVAGETANVRVSSQRDLRLAESLLAERRAREDGR